MVEFRPINNSLIKRLQNIYTNLPQHQKGLSLLQEQAGGGIKAPLQKDVFFGEWKHDKDNWTSDKNNWKTEYNEWPLNNDTNWSDTWLDENNEWTVKNKHVRHH